MKMLLFSILLLLTCVLILFSRAEPTKFDASLRSNKTVRQKKEAENDKLATTAKLKSKCAAVREFANVNGYSTKYCFLVDLAQPSGRKRFFIYQMQSDSIIAAGLVAHGSCQSRFLQTPSFSNVPGCGCSSLGKYKVGYSYDGQYGPAFKLVGLDSTNSNAFVRTVVLHAYDCVPDEEVYPLPICNSLGCPMVSYKFLGTLAAIIKASQKPVLLWIYN